ncbi:MAG: F0F1 ATP synthase subunit delta [Bdellovibrionales bacterium]|nr:F0F1 ATP synthase subunit delta [Bdellovibrionales bacterium]
MHSVGDLYAKTLFELEAEGALQICELKKALSAEDLSFFCSSLIPVSDKFKVLDQIPFSENVLRFLHRLTLNNRWSYFGQICESVEKLVDEKQGVVRGVIYTAKPLLEGDKKTVEASVQKFFKNRKVLLKVQQKEDLINGLRVEVGGMSFDDSILHHLQHFKAQVRKYEN